MVAIASFWDERKLLVFVALIIVASVVMLVELDAARRGDRSLPDQLITSVIVPVEDALTQTATAVTSSMRTFAHAGSLASENIFRCADADCVGHG